MRGLGVCNGVLSHWRLSPGIEHQTGLVQCKTMVAYAHGALALNPSTRLEADPALRTQGLGGGAVHGAGPRGLSGVASRRNYRERGARVAPVVCMWMWLVLLVAAPIT